MELDKSKWKRVKLDDVVINKKITVDARNCGLDRYIAGDHMTTEDLHVRRFGLIGEDYLGPAFHRKFEKGDILYGSRRTYLKKVAIADFDGITSNTTFVLRENEDKLIPGLIPFLMLSDRFTAHSVMHSKGSVNPYINYKDIAQYEFLLPPKQQQLKLAELLWAADDVENALIILSNRFRLNRKFIIQSASTKAKKYYHLGELGTVLYGMGIPPIQTENAIPVIRATNIHLGEIFEKDLIRAKPEDVSVGRRIFLKEGDIIVVRSGAYTGDIGYIDSKWEGSLAGYDLVLKPDLKLINPILLKELLLSNEIQKYFKNESTRSAQPHLNAEQLRSTVVPKIERGIQDKLADQISELIKLQQDVDYHSEETIRIKKQLINQIFS